MDFRETLIESDSKQKRRGGWKTVVASVAIHAALVGGIVVLGMQATDKVDASETAIPVFVQQVAPPPPPPPPPPAPAKASSSTPHVTPKVQPVQVKPQTFVQPREVPKEVPKTEVPVTTQSDAPADDTPSTEAPSVPDTTGGVEGGVAGGVQGGVQGGVVGGQVGGQIGGELGGVVGGVVGGTKGGEVGGQGDSVEAPSGPLRVGGNVKAPVVTRRVEPQYTEVARKGKVAGVVILEAIIDRNGNVDKVKTIRGLPLGLTEAAENAVRQWKFRPGTLNGQPVDVIFNLTVVFKVDGSVSSGN